MMEFPVFPDMTYQQKWQQVFDKINKQEFLDFLNEFQKVVYKSSFMDQELLNQIFQNMDAYEKYHPEMIQEIKAIWEVCQDCDLNQLYLINFTYEIFAHQDACLSIIIKNSKGDLFMGRNLDFFFQKYYSKYSIQFNYYNKQGQLDYSTSQFLGYVIIVQGIKYGKFAFSLNERDSGSIEQNLAAFLNGHYSNEYLMLDVLKSSNNYQEAVQQLQTQPIIASCYYIVIGNKDLEGVIIERDRKEPYKNYYLNEDTWYLVATNYDQDKIDRDGRRDYAINQIQNIGQDQMDIQKLYQDVLKQYPDFHYMTISTSLMNPKNNYFEQFVFI